MNYPAMRHVAEHCRLEGAPRALLWAMSYRADREGECWAGQRRLAREAGISRKSVERWLPRLVGMGLLELVEEGTGPRPDCYRFSPTWVEGIGSSSGVVEGASSAPGIVEGEVIHNPGVSGDTVSPVDGEHAELVATLLGASGDTVSSGAELVATLGNESGYSQLLLPAATPPVRPLTRPAALRATWPPPTSSAGSSASTRVPSSTPEPSTSAPPSRCRMAACSPTCAGCMSGWPAGSRRREPRAAETGDIIRHADTIVGINERRYVGSAGPGEGGQTARMGDRPDQGRARAVLASGLVYPAIRLLGDS
jgi:hypothetical protein